MKCPNCGADKGTNDKFCGYCGTKLEIVEPIPEAAIETAAQPTKKKGKGPIIGMIVFLVVSVFAVTSVFAYNRLVNNSKTPEELLAESMLELFDAEQGEYRSTIRVEDLDMKLEDSQEAMIGDLIANMVIKTVARYDMDQARVEGQIDLEMMSTSLVSLDFYLDTEMLMLDIPLIHDKSLYIRHEDLAKLVQGQMVQNLVMNAIMGFGMTSESEETEPLIAPSQIQEAIDIGGSLLDRNQYETYGTIDRTPYLELLAAYLLEVVPTLSEGDFEIGDTSYKGTTFNMVYDQEESDWLMSDMLEELSEDPQVTLFIEEVMTTFFDKIIQEENYLLYALLMEEDPTLMDEWLPAYGPNLKELQESLVEQVGEGMKNAKYEIRDVTADLAYNPYTYGMDMNTMYEDLDMSTKIYMDDKNVLRGQSSQMTVLIPSSNGQDGAPEDSITISIETVYANIGGEVVFDGVDTEKALDLGTMDQEAMMTFITEVQKNVTENIMNNPMFKDLFIMGY